MRPPHAWAIFHHAVCPMIPDDYASLLATVQHDVNVLLVRFGRSGWTALWPLSVPLDGPMLGLFLEHKRLRVTMFLSVPTDWVWTYASSERARERVARLVREKCDGMAVDVRPAREHTPPATF